MNRNEQEMYKDMKDILDNVQDYIGTRATFTYIERTKLFQSMG